MELQSAVIDGELVCLDEIGRSQFDRLLFRRGDPFFYAFDLLWLNGEDLRGLPLIERKMRLRFLVKGAQRILYLDHLEENGCGLFERVCAIDMEGIVAKPKLSTYPGSAQAGLGQDQEPELFAGHRTSRVLRTHPYTGTSGKTLCEIIDEWRPTFASARAAGTTPRRDTARGPACFTR